MRTLTLEQKRLGCSQKKEGLGETPQHCGFCLCFSKITSAENPENYAPCSERQYTRCTTCSEGQYTRYWQSKLGSEIETQQYYNADALGAQCQAACTGCWCSQQPACSAPTAMCSTVRTLPLAHSSVNTMQSWPPTLPIVVLNVSWTAIARIVKVNEIDWKYTHSEKHGSFLFMTQNIIHLLLLKPVK